VVYRALAKNLVSTEISGGRPKEKMNGACQSMEEDVVYLYTRCGCAAACSVTPYVSPHVSSSALRLFGVNMWFTVDRETFICMFVLLCRFAT
jgi:hypothetical protein